MYLILFNYNFDSWCNYQSEVIVKSNESIFHFIKLYKCFITCCGARVFRAHGKASSILALVNSPPPQASCIRRPPAVVAELQLLQCTASRVAAQRFAACGGLRAALQGRAFPEVRARAQLVLILR